MEKQRYAIIGSGALGGLYGGMLARGGHEVHFLLHSDFGHVSQYGMRIESHLGNFELPQVNAHQSVETIPPCDVTLVGLKATRNALLADLLPSPTREGGLVLVLQNGLDVEADAAAVVGEDRVLGGCCFLCSNKVGPGHIKHLDYGQIVFGEYSGQHDSITPRVQRIADEMVASGIDAKPTQDLLLTRWRKLMWNIPFNGLSVVLNATTKELVEDPSAVALVESMIAEVHAAAELCGANIDPAMKAKTIDVTRSMVPYDSSMRLDYLHQRPMEVESIFGNPIRSAKQHGASMRLVEMLYQQLKFIDARNIA